MLHSKASAVLEFDPGLTALTKGKELRDGLSTVLQMGRTLWLANDESIGLERLTLQGSSGEAEYRFAEHKQFALSDYLSLPVPPSGERGDVEEVDVEGLAVHDDYVWIVGSHSLKRGKPHKDDPAKKNAKRLADVRSDGNRFLLARVPVVVDGGTYSLEKQAPHNESVRTAARLRGDETGNDLTKALAKDKHLKPFFKSGIPGKDNGFDVEGLAVSAGGRLLMGLRGPVLHGFAMIIEIELKTHDSQTLRLRKIGPDDQPYRKHFLHLGGLGIRELCVQGSDLLILAGPTLDLDGPVAIFRWQGGADPDEETLLPKHTLKALAQVPVGAGVDHPEGMTMFSPDGSDARSLLVVYDSPAEERQLGQGAVRADIFDLP